MSIITTDNVGTTRHVMRLPSSSAASGTAPRKVTSSWCFLLGLGGMTFVRLIGYLAFSEIYLLITALWRFGRHLSLITTGVVGVFSLLWLAWVCAAVTSDLANDVLFELLARGVSRAVLTGVATLSIFIICYPSMKRLEWILLGLPLSMIISLFYFRPGQAEMFGSTTKDIMQFDTSLNYIATAVAMAAAASLYKRYPMLVIAALFTLAPIYIVLGSRSAGAVMFLAAATTSMFYFSQSRSRRRGSVGVFRLAALLVISVCGIAVVKYGYEYAAESRLLGEKYVRKYEQEKQAMGGVFVGSRGVYILTGLLAWRDRPLLGHGSWPEDSAGYYSQASQMVGRSYKPNPVGIGGIRVRNLLPVHSQLFGSLVEHGVLAFAFFAYMTWLVLWSITFVPAAMPNYTALFSILYWANLWNFVASPQSHRIPTAVGWAFFLLAYAHRNAMRKQAITHRRVGAVVAPTRVVHDDGELQIL